MSYHQKWTLRAVVLLVALAGAIWAVRQQYPNSAAALLRTDHLPWTDNRPAFSAPPQLYPYSVILGGVRSAGELKLALAKDEVARVHYAGFDVERAHPVFAGTEMLRYVSYRRNNQVYWTAKPVRVQKGELLLADGDNFARARCGNRLSATAKQPTEAHPPANVDEAERLSFVFGPYPPADFSLPNFTEDALTSDEVLLPDAAQTARLAPGANPAAAGQSAASKILPLGGDLARNFAPLATNGPGLVGLVPRTVTGATGSGRGGAGTVGVIGAQGVLTPEPSTSALVLSGVLLLTVALLGRRLF